MNCAGVCTVCLDKLSKDLVGCQCQRCFKRYHLQCGNIDSSKLTKESGAKWMCPPCVREKKVHSMLESQHNTIEKIPQLISTQIQSHLKTFEENLTAGVIAPLKEEFSCLASAVEACKNNMNHDQMIKCKSELIISGLPANIKEPKKLREIVLRIGDIYKLKLVSHDIHDCTRLSRGDRVLVRFGNVFARNDLMELYLKSKNLMLSQILETNIESRVYLNNNFPPSVHKSIMHCRKLKSMKRIVNFKVDYLSGLITLTLENDVVEKYSDFKLLSSAHRIQRINQRGEH